MVEAQGKSTDVTVQAWGGTWLGYGILFTGGLLTIYYSTYLIYSDFLKVIGAASIIPSVMLISTIAAVIAVLLAGPLA